jgi:ADP-ribose pyrophosphatase
VLLLAGAEDRGRLVAWLEAAGVRPMPTAAFEAARIEHGYPCNADIPEKTLPQEIGRDATAISFTKGCYLGQETVARIDALGHVNRRLAAFSVEGPVPAAGSTVTFAGEIVGRVGSACESPRLGMPLALAIVHVKALAAGGSSAAMVGGRPARVVPLPVPPPDPPRTVLLEARRFRVVSLDEPLADGSRRGREVVEHPGSVVILPLLDEASPHPKVCLVENHRVAIGRAILELPAGTLDRDESLEEAARRELAEETGYRADRVVAMGGFWVSPGILRERMHLFRAEGLVAGEQALEAGERIVVRIVAWEDALAMCLDGRIEDAKTIAGILMEQARRHPG